MGIKINNPDYKIYQYKHKPCIETADWKQAFDWNSKRFKIFHIFKKQNMYMTCNCKELTREKCISHLDYLKKVDKETSFDDLITNTSFFKIILFNNVEWESSICSCFNWHKNLKCDHVISLATRLKLADFMTIAYSTPIGRQNKPGRPQMTHFLERDKDEEDNGYGNGVDDAYGVDISEPESEPGPEPEPEPTLIVRAKRGRPSKADIEARKTLSTTTTTTPNRASKRSKKF